jgi:RND superfamily putative drug exporter
MRSHSPLDIAARAGRWSARNRKKAIFGWLAFVFAALAVGSAIGTNTLTSDEQGVGESGRADRAIGHAFPKTAEEQVIVQPVGTTTTRDRRFRATIDDVASRLKRTEYVQDVRSPLDRGNAGQLAPDRRSALVQFKIAGDEEQTKDRVDATLAAVAAVQKAHPGFVVQQFGDASANKGISKSYEDDFKRAETLSLPITLVILVVAFGALVAASIPLLLALSAVMGTLGVVGLVSQIAPVSESISSVLLLIGLAVGVDYSMFYLRREREERAAGRSSREALETAAATSGRAVLVSGFTVMIAMAGMYLAGDSTFASFGTGTILVVAAGMVGSLTVLPAVLSALGDRVEKGRVPGLGRVRRGGESRAWGALVARVMRRPKLAAALSAGVLVALTIPALGMHTQVPGIESLPRDVPVMRTYDRIQAAFPGGPAPSEVVVRAGDVTAPDVQAAIADMREQAKAAGAAHDPITTEVSKDRSTEVVSLPMPGDGTDDASQKALTTIRHEVIPATVGKVAKADVTGQAAGTRDFNDSMNSHIPYVFAFVLSLAFLLLLVTFRSIVIPLKAIVLNLLSVGAAYGVLTLVFQHGWFKSLLGFQSTGAITSWLPLFLFVVLFGLSMDYHVFILSRIREAVDRGMSTDDAVAHGIRSTAGVVTSAAVVMVAVFAIFASLGMLEMKQMGVGLAAAILIDATLVRGVLLPASMKLLGDWNWYLPRRLQWLPRVQHEPAPAPARG